MKITVYSTPECPFCIMVKEFLDSYKLEYTEIDVSANEQAAAEMISRSGQMGVPVIIVEKDKEEDIIVGYNQEELARILGIQKERK